MSDHRDSCYWVKASGGYESPFTCQGKRFLYMWNTSTKEHAYYCITDDIFVQDEDLKQYGLN